MKLPKKELLTINKAMIGWMIEKIDFGPDDETLNLNLKKYSDEKGKIITHRKVSQISKDIVKKWLKVESNG